MYPMLRAHVPQRWQWPKIVGMRHRMVHVYYDVDCNALWEVVAHDLQPMVVALEGALKEWPQEQ